MPGQNPVSGGFATGQARCRFFYSVMRNHKQQVLLAIVGGMLFGLAIILASQPLNLYGWAALAAYIGLQLAAPLAKHLYNQEETEGGVL